MWSNITGEGGVTKTMRCLDHMDMTVMTGAVATVASAVFLFAYLGIDREMTAPPAPPGPEILLRQDIDKAMVEAAALPARAGMERARTQAALGRAIVNLIGVKESQDSLIPSLAKRAAAETVPQEELGRLIVDRSLLAASAAERAEERYGRAVAAAMTAIERERSALAFAAPLMDGVAVALPALAPEVAPTTIPMVTREPAWGFGSIGDGVVLPIMILGAGFLALAACWHGLTEMHVGTRTVETHCDLHQKDVVVEVLVSDDAPYEVAHCSAFNGGPLTCDKHCLKWELARAA